MKSEGSTSAIPGIQQFRQLYSLFFEQQDPEKTEKAMRVWMRREPGFQTFVLGHLLYGCLMHLSVQSKLHLSSIARNETLLNEMVDRLAEMVASASTSMQQELVALRETVELLGHNVSDPTDEPPDEQDQNLTDELLALLEAARSSEELDTAGHDGDRE